MRQRLKVLLLKGSEASTVLLEEILNRHVILDSAGSIPEMLRLLGDGDYDVFLCDWRFSMGTWRDALEEVQACHPELLTIVLCRAGGEHEWTEVLEAGAFDLLTAPHRECAVLSVLEHAVASRDARAIGIVT